MKPPDADVHEKVRQWLVYADEDLLLAQHSFSLPSSPPYRLIAYHAQQCAEKCLKAYLVFHLVDFPYTHRIAPLLDLCTEHGAWAAKVRDAEALSPYAITARYPGEDEAIVESEARRAIEIAERLRNAIRKALQDEGLEITA